MRLAIVGSRTFNDYYRMSFFISQIYHTIDMIVSGGASGADSCGAIYARNNHIPLRVYPAKWNLYGKQAGYIRNKTIVANSDQVIAFWDGVSKGTLLTITLAIQQQKPLTVIMV